MILSAPLILPMEGLPIENGAVLVRGDAIAELGPAAVLQKKYPDEPRTHLSECVLLPGFVNAHSHLELTCLQGLAYPGNFSDWIRKVVEAKPLVSEEDYRKGIEEGVQRMIQSGVTTVGDHVSFNTDLDCILKSPLRGILFIEVLGVAKEVAEDLLRAAETFEKIYKGSPRFKITATPHSAHALHPDVLPKLFTSSRPLLSIHLAESEDEDRYFRKKSGPLFDLIFERSGGSCKSPSPSTGLQYLDQRGLLSDRVMVVHGNYLDAQDLTLLSKYQISVVHCPSSRAYFFHKNFPFALLQERKINIALGTDSLGSGDSLSMIDQIRIGRAYYPDIPAAEWIQIATLGGAKALKMEKEIGSLAPGKKADLIAFRISPAARKDPRSAFGEILESDKVVFSMIGGETAFSQTSPS